MRTSFPLPVLDTGCGCSVLPQWMTLEERESGLDCEQVAREFPPSATTQSPRGLERRQFLQIASAAAAMVGLGGCFREPSQEVLPYTERPRGVTPGEPLHFTTGSTLDGLTLGLVATSREGHPLKMDGNRLHSASLGATGPIEQASLLSLYDPKRARTVLKGGAPVSVAELRAALAQMAQRKDGGAGLRFLVEPTASPRLLDAYAQILARWPNARFARFAPARGELEDAALKLAFGQPVSLVPRLDRARVVLSVDWDFMKVTPATLRAAHDFVEARASKALNRLYVAESDLTLTGIYADERQRAKPSRLLHLLSQVAARVGEATGNGELASLANHGAGLLPYELSWAKRCADDLLAHRGEALVLAGPRQDVSTQALALAVSQALGAFGKTLEVREPLLGPNNGLVGLAELADEMQGGRVDTLIVTAWNPVFSAPVDVPFRSAISRVPRSVYLGLHADETASACHWFVPAAHPYEQWRDGRAFDGTASILQPLIAPLFADALAELDVLSPFFAAQDRDGHALIKDFWRTRAGASDFATTWREWLGKGVIAGTESKAVAATLRTGEVARAVRAAPASTPGLELVFAVDGKVHDGRFAQNAWLQELPDPVTQLTWDNAALVGPVTARKLSLKTGQLARLRVRGRALELPVLVLPGMADDTVSVALGYGHGVGANAYALRSSSAPWRETGLEVEALSRSAELALAQAHWRMEGRELALERTAKDFDPASLEHLREKKEHFFGPQPASQSGKQWGMAIDLNRCIGCSACVVACQAENNIPAVGKEQVRLGREMQWLRIDRYFMGSEENPTAITQPVACVHCEFAPCEYVCPVNATVHSAEGLNQQVYNRCIGTRYCSNNCPYKVRRFNYLNYTQRTALEQMAANPEVTVRSRGVMEKCTYCVQRIEAARIRSRISGEPMAQVRTACQEACPTRAIVFGDISDPNSEVARLREDERHYKLLNELGTRPRTVHLVRLKNPNPVLT